MLSPAIYFSRFKPTYDSGGGSRRMMQIYEILKNNISDLELINGASGDKAERRLKEKVRIESERRYFFAPPRRSIRLRKWHEDHLTLAYRLQEFSKIWARSLNVSRVCKLAILDDPIYFIPLLKKLKSLRVPVIVNCHNIETLAAHQVKKKWALDFLKKELELLSQCRLVITISREEDVLLNNLGIPSFFLPYYPGEPVRGRLLAVRGNRANQAKDGFLAIGNAGNLQTRKGMESLCRSWQKNNLEAVAGKLLLGGFKSHEYFRPGQFGCGVEILGSLSNDTLDAMLSRVKACICYQENGAGALTRIGELLMAGVPVLANTNAARSYYNTKGLIEFRGLDDLGEALQQFDGRNGAIPVPPAPDVSSLSLEIQKILQQVFHDLSGTYY